MKKTELLAEQARLHALANELARKHWGVDYTGTITLVNYEWRSYNGKFRHKRDRNDLSLQEIRMSAITNARRTPEEVEGTLLHELVHWRLFVTGEPNSDEDYAFIVECLRVGAPISKARAAQDAYKRFTQIQRFEERTGRNYLDVAV